MRLLLNFGRENSWCRQNLIEMLELLTCLLLIRVRHRISINLCHIWESINNESSQENCIRNFVVLDGQRCQTLEGLQLGDLNETVDVIVLEQELLQVDETLQLRDVRWADDAIEPDILE